MNNKAPRLTQIFSGLFLLATAVVAQAQLSIEPITWDVVGLDSNRPVTEGPNLFPVGAEVCNVGTTTSETITAQMVWTDDPADDTYIFTRPGSKDVLEFEPLAADECIDAYFEIEVKRDPQSFEKFRPYQIKVGEGEFTDVEFTAETPDTRAIYVERLVSQNRNTTSLIRWGQQSDGLDWQELGFGSGMNLRVGETYFIELTTETSTGYEQLQSFLTLSNTIFQVKSVETDYETLTAPSSRVPEPNPRLWADACLWESDFDSPNWLSCLDDGKAGGQVVTTYEIDIISGGGDSVGLLALIYDKSGSSFHYNTDFSQSPGDANTFDPDNAGFAKRFLPSTISLGNTSRLLFTISNPNPVDLGGYTFVDNLPAGLAVAATPNASSTCGGVWNPPAGETSLNFDIDSDVIAANSTCSIGVDIAAPGGINTYENESENLFFEGTDTGLFATASLVVNDAPPPPACVVGQTHSQWVMDEATAPPGPSFVYSGDLADAIAAFSAASGGVQSIVENPLGAAATDEAWAGTGWSTTLEPDGPGPDELSYFEFELDSAAFATNPTEPMAVSLDAIFETPQAWANNQNITLNIWVSQDAEPFERVLNQNDINKNQLNPLSATFTPGSGSTRIRINASGIAQNQGDGAQLILDNVQFTGCGPADQNDILAPTLTKDFSPDPIGVGQVSTLTFTVSNPNTTTGDDLTGIEFADLLPPDVVVAPTTNAETTCSGTWEPSAGDSQLTFTDGSLLADDSSCTVSVDVTSSVVGTHINISDFIYANESGQNNTPAGQASDTLTVLARPAIEKAFDPGLLLVGSNEPDVSWLEFTITNPNPLDPISGVAFDDVFPANLVVAEPATGPAELSVDKQLIAQTDDPIVVGTVLTYEITATNTDSAALTGVVVTDSLVAVDLDNCDWPTTQGELPVGEPVTCSIDYTVTQADLDAGEVVNTAAAMSNETGVDEALYRLLTPLADNGCGAETWAPEVGGGTVSLSGATIAGGGTCTVGVWVTGPLGVYDNLSDPVTHVIGGTAVPGNAAADTLVIDEPIAAIALDKQVGFGSNPEGAWRDYLAVEIGDQVYYRLIVENVGETELTGIDVEDLGVDTSMCTWPASLPVADASAPLAHIATCVVDPVDVTTAGVFPNTATASGTGNGALVQDTDSATYATAELTLVKSADRSTFDAAGQIINYTFAVTNSGSAVVSGPVTIDDELVPGAICESLTAVGNFDNFFDPGEIVICTGSYTTTSTDVTNGQVVNAAFASVPEVDSNIDDWTVVVPAPALSVVKTLDSAPTPIVVGSELTYSVTATNDGNVTLNNVVVSDTIITPSTTTCATLAPGADCVLTGSYTVTQSDVDAGQIVNTGTADSDETLPIDDTVVTPVSQTVGIGLSKLIDAGDPYSSVGDTITYAITAENTGNVTLSAVSISDPVATIGTCTPAQPTSLAPGATLSCAATYSVTQADLDSGSFTNTATVQGSDPDSNPVSAADTATANASGTPSLSVVKSLDSAPTPIVAGSELTYSVTATNDGNVTLNNVAVSDTIITPSTTTCATLAPGADCLLTGTYTVTQPDIDAGEIVNTGAATSTETPDPEEDTVTTPVDQTPALTLVKSAGEPTGSSEGETITYTFEVTNTGNVTIASLVINDAQLDAAATCNETSLEPAASTTCTGEHTIRQAEVDAGQVDNTATAEGVEPGEQPVISPPSSTSTPLGDVNPLVDPDVSITKTADPASGSGVTAGQTIAYTLSVEITEGVLTTDLVLEDMLGTGLTFDTVSAPGEFVIDTTNAPALAFTLSSGTVPGSYEVVYTATVDADATGTVGNSVVVTGTGGDPDPECPNCTTNHPVAALSLLKTASEPTGSGEGDTIAYTFEVTNTGNVTIARLVINDEQLDEQASCNETSLEPSAVTTCTGVHTITQAEVEAGQVDNTATAEGVASGEQPVISPPSSTSTPLGDVNPLVDPDVSITKTADPASGSDVTSGQMIAYTLSVEITEGVLTTDLVLEDTLGTGLTFDTVSAPGEFVIDTTNAPALAFTLSSGTVPGSYEVVYTATVDADATGSVGNNVAVTGNGGDPEPACASCDTSHPIASPPVEPPPPAAPIAVNSLSRTGVLLLIMLALIAGFRGVALRRA